MRLDIARNVVSLLHRLPVPTTAKKSSGGVLRLVGRIDNTSAAPPKPVSSAKSENSGVKSQLPSKLKQSIANVFTTQNGSNAASLAKTNREGNGASVGKLNMAKFAHIEKCIGNKSASEVLSLIKENKAHSAEAINKPNTANVERTLGAQPQLSKAVSPAPLKMDGQGVPVPPPWMDSLPVVKHTSILETKDADVNTGSTAKFHSKPTQSSEGTLWSKNLLDDLQKAFNSLRQKR
ncbi:hypothetical protein [Sodalis praecaptivus]|nr:hypothetical protein [Sodalis praecaptivus]